MAFDRETESYTAAELQRETGFDRRTIAYYVHEGLLPKVGRRGSRTRYPKLVRDRLLFIRQVREAEQRGIVAPVSLRDMRKIFEHTPPELISGVADGRIPVNPEAVSTISPSIRPLARRREAIEERWAPVRKDRPSAEFPGRLADSRFHEPGPEESEAPERHYWRDSHPEEKGNRRATDQDDPNLAYQPIPVEDSEPGRESELGELLAALQDIADHRRQPSPAMDRWLQVEVSPDITLSVRGVNDEAAALLERAVHRLRRLMREHAEVGMDEEEDES
ncbi:MAG: MerR family transcriptional regulator [Acidobacteriota bacterium]|nr:MerR family transcriptional regulator [Acidobacteriota bacterium]